MIKFDEMEIASALSGVEGYLQVAFATAAATRQLANFESYAQKFDAKNEQILKKVAEQLWFTLQGQEGGIDGWPERLETVMELLPEESDIWTIEHAFAEDAVATLAYAIRCLLASDPHEAAWAARRAYEATDQAAIRLSGIQLGEDGVELQLLGHPVVQRELARQRRDLLKLRDPAPATQVIRALQELAFTEGLFTQEERLELIHSDVCVIGG